MSRLILSYKESQRQRKPLFSTLLDTYKGQTHRGVTFERKLSLRGVRNVFTTGRFIGLCSVCISDEEALAVPLRDDLRMTTSGPTAG